MNRRRTWTPLRRMPLTTTGAEPEQWQILNARPTGCFQLDADLDRRIHGCVRNAGRTGSDPEYARNLCSPSVDHRQLLELASDIAAARAGRG